MLVKHHCVHEEHKEHRNHLHHLKLISNYTNQYLQKLKSKHASLSPRKKYTPKLGLFIIFHFLGTMLGALRIPYIQGLPTFTHSLEFIIKISYIIFIFILIYLSNIKIDQDSKESFPIFFLSRMNLDIH